MTKQKKCYSLEDDIVGTISRIAAAKQLPDSDIMGTVIKQGLAHNLDITAAERFHYQREVIMKALDAVLRTMGVIELEGSIGDKVRHSLYACHGLKQHKSRKVRASMVELSVFEVLNEIQYLDMELFTELKIEMRHFGRMRDRFEAMYGK